MTDASDKIPFAIDISRMISLLAEQIYPTPFALLRENVQNAFDAILLRQQLGQAFDAKIDISIEPQRVRVEDNGIGMSRDDLRNHFWRAGSSSKNTDTARAAGVVGTFGIGAMANFGIADRLTVETESAVSGERTRCEASLATLSVTDDCITFTGIAPHGAPGTIVEASVQPGTEVNVADAQAYIASFVAFLPIAVLVNGRVVSGQDIESSVPLLTRTWAVSETCLDLGDGFQADVEVTGSISGEVRLGLRNILSGGEPLAGLMLLRQGTGTLRTFRSGFGLATASVSSVYGFGGVADFLFLQPTAGREALTTTSLQLLQRLVARVDEFVSLCFAQRPESNSSVAFVGWAAKRRRFDLCRHLRVRVEPGDSITLEEARERSVSRPLLVYSGTDAATIAHASEDQPIVILSQNTQRRECELGYLKEFCKIEELANQPTVLIAKPDSDTSAAEKAIAFRIASILSTDYFLESRISFGTISHGLPILVTRRTPPVEIALDPKGPTVSLMVQLYEKEYTHFGHMAKDFVRNTVFGKVADLVPSSTRQGAEAFLKSIHKTREVFEYESADLESLTSLWQDYLGGKLTFQQATERSKRVAARSYQVVDSAAAAAVRDVVPDVIENEESVGQVGPQLGAVPPFERLDMSTPKKILTIADGEPALRGYRCFLALTDKIREEKGDFFLQPHRTSVVWGGQKALFIFEHHSGEFGLYYDLQTQGLISDVSGGGAFDTCTIVMKNRIFVPIPPAIQTSFLPTSHEKKRFEVRCDILYIDRPGTDGASSL